MRGPGRSSPRLAGVLASLLGLSTASLHAQEGVRLYVIDCGQLNRGEPTRYELTSADVADTDFADPCFLVVHPDGRLLWDLGIIPDDDIEAGLTVQPPEGGVGSNEAFRTLGAQMREIGYGPEDITHVAFSHHHADHVANANDYADALWIVQRRGRVEMFTEEARERGEFSRYRDLERSETLLLDGDHDVFEDGSVVILATPGHTEGHQSLQVRLDRSGTVILSGDLFHYAAERELGRMPTAERQRGTPESRAKVERLLRETGGQLWIQHDVVRYAELRKAPESYN